MERVNSFTEDSLKYYRTALLCPTGVHGAQPVRTVTEDGLAVLACGCTRKDNLPIREGKVSVEQLSPFTSKQDQTAAARLFPAAVSSLKTTSRRWSGDVAP